MLFPSSCFVLLPLQGNTSLVLQARACDHVPLWPAFCGQKEKVNFGAVQATAGDLISVAQEPAGHAFLRPETPTGIRLRHYLSVLSGAVPVPQDNHRPI